MIRMIPEWRRAWRMLSVQAAGLAVLFGALPADQQAALLQLLGIEPARLPLVLGLSVIIGRLVDQPKTRA